MHFWPCIVAHSNLAQPGLEPLVNPLALRRARDYQVEAPNVVLIDGTVRGPGAGRLRDREAIFRRLRDRAETALEVAELGMREEVVAAAMTKLSFDARYSTLAPEEAERWIWVLGWRR